VLGKRPNIWIISSSSLLKRRTNEGVARLISEDPTRSKKD